MWFTGYIIVDLYFIGGVLGYEGEESLLDGTEDGTAVSPLSTEVSKLSTKPPRNSRKASAYKYM